MQKFGKTGVLLVNLGTPDEPNRSAVYRYLQQFLLDRRVMDFPWLSRNLLVRGLITPFRSGNSAKLYQKLWTEQGSPLKFYSERLAAGVQEALGNDYAVALAMRYQNPSIESALQQLLAERVHEIIVLPLFPQYASASTGSVHEEVMRLLAKEEAIPNVRLVNSFYDYEPMIEIFVDNARKFDIESYDHILFSFHGLPERQLLKVDSSNHCMQSPDCCQRMSVANQFCYSAQCHATARAIATQLDLSQDRYTICFQSRLGPGEWVKPYTIKVLEALAEKGAKRLLVFSPAFVADCLETVVEISDEYQQEFEKMGGETVDLVPSLNDNPKWIQAVVALVRENE